MIKNNNLPTEPSFIQSNYPKDLMERFIKDLEKRNNRLWIQYWGSLYLSSAFSFQILFDYYMLPKKVSEDWKTLTSQAYLSVFSSSKYVKKVLF